MSQKITMIGAGYVGLVTGACFAEIGHDVICVDRDVARIGLLEAGGLPIYEPGLEDIVHRNVREGRLRFSTVVADSVAGRDAIFVCVGTPADKKSGHANLDYVFGAVAEVAAAVDGFSVIVTKSTVPVGTNRRIAAVAAQHLRPGAGVAVASNPEFLREGAAIGDFMEPDRVVVGTDDPMALDIMRKIYLPLVGALTPLVETGIETAELIKYAANGFLATKLSFINEVSDLCEVVGADIDEVARGIGLDKRIGGSFLKVGPGWGGSCFPKDTQAFHATAQEAGVPVRIIEAAIAANASRKKSMARRIAAACGGDVAGKKIAVLGLTFKGETDDMRESPTLEFLPALLAMGARVHGFDPARPPEASRLLPGVVIEDSPRAVAEDADLLVVATEWKEFRAYDLGPLAAAMANPVMLDLRNLFAAQDVLDAGFISYHCLGKRAAVRDRRGRGTSPRLQVIPGG